MKASKPAFVMVMDGTTPIAIRYFSFVTRIP